jgi:hypothetical protein
MKGRLASYPVSELFGEPFRVVKGLDVPLDIPGVDKLSNERGPHRILEVHFRKAGLLPIEEWRLTGSKSRTSFMSTGLGAVVLKPELEVFPKIGTIGRNPNRPFRDSVAVLRELLRRRARIEVPLGALVTKEGRRFYVVKPVPGVDLEEKLEQCNPREMKAIAQGMAAELAGLHLKGIVHSHPHAKNWVVDGLKPKLVDVKAVAFQPDFPHKFAFTGRIYTWPQAVNNDLIYARNSLPDSMGNFFLQEYQKSVQKKTH